MNDADGLLNKQQRKKKKRKQRKHDERQAHRNLDDVTTLAIAEASRLAPIVVASPTLAASDRVIDVELASLSEAKFVRKRVNDTLRAGEWLDEVSVWIWQASEHHRPALSEGGRERGIELRIEQIGPS